jgi:hypothetical protein
MSEIKQRYWCDTCSCHHSDESSAIIHGKPPPPTAYVHTPLRTSGSLAAEADAVREWTICDVCHLSFKQQNSVIERSAYEAMLKERDEQRDAAIGLVEKWREASAKLDTARAALEPLVEFIEGVYADGAGHFERSKYLEVTRNARKELEEIGEGPSHMGLFGGEGIKK